MSDKISGHHVGNPVRAAIAERAGAGYIPPGDYPMSILVFGGSQGARILSDVVPPAIASLPMAMLSHIRVSHQARPEDQERVAAYYAEQNIPADVRPFFDDIPTRMSETQLVISRAGASTVADISVIGRPSILVPLAAAIRDEQSANAMGLVNAGGAELMRETDFQVNDLTVRLEAFFADPVRASQMAGAALKTSVPDATQRLMDLIQTLIKKDT
jgi:UDP-N-acetylglucosamine--N-acetylmuramyl-(pentapeptide) pyrophosphoryl-undecaprenol N-acetylglucosamine transferase